MSPPSGEQGGCQPRARPGPTKAARSGVRAAAGARHLPDSSCARADPTRRDTAAFFNARGVKASGITLAEGHIVIPGLRAPRA